MSEKVGTRSFREEEQDAGVGFVRVNDVSPSMQEMIDLEIKRIMQVHVIPSHSLTISIFSRNPMIEPKLY